MKIRRAVTGHDANGKAVFVSDEEVDGVRPALMPGSESHVIWGADSTLHFPDDGSQPKIDRYFPPVSGFRFGFVAIHPEERDNAQPPEDMEAALAELRDLFPGMSDYVTPEDHGMHATDSVDLLIVMEGDIWLELDDGVTKKFSAGDTIIQNGTRHGWRNYGTKTCRMACILIGAEHDNAPASKKKAAASAP